MSLKAAFTLKLAQQVQTGTVCVGKLDGIHPSLVAATDKGRVFIHTPHRRSADTGGRLLHSTDAADISTLNLNQQVKSLAVGKLRVDQPEKDVIVVGTTTHVLGYDVDDNMDLFHREVPDGVNAVTIGHMGGIRQPVAMCGGNCAIQAFDANGHDPFWTVTGDNVTALCLCDIDQDGDNELIVGSEDFDIRVYKGDEIISESSETDTVTSIVYLGGKRFAYALANGTLGVYESLNRIWRIKSKNVVTAIHWYDILSTGQAELVVGWSNGKVDFRQVESGEVVIRETLSSGCAGLVVADYRMDGHQQLICVAEDGHLRGFLRSDEGGIVLQNDPKQEVMHELVLRKQHLNMELNNYEENKRVAATGQLSQPSEITMRIGAIPANTHLQTTLYVHPGSPDDPPCVELFVKTSNDTMIRSVMVFAEGIFQGESHVVHPALSTVHSECRVAIRPTKDLSVDLHVKCLVGYKSSSQYHVFELSRTLPRFSMYALCNEQAPAADSYVTFATNERPQRIALWINENFLLQEEITCTSEDTVDARFFSLRGAGMLFIQMDSNGKVHIRCDDMELCGTIVAAMAEFFAITDLESQAEFPEKIALIVSLVDKVNEIYMVRDQLSGDVADISNLIKGLIVRAEDARLMKDMMTMKRYYNQLYSLNQELITQYKVRCANHQELLNCLKQINQIIQQAGKLRVGKPKSNVITACRDALKENQSDILPKIIRLGAA